MTSATLKIVNHTVRANGIRQHYLDAGEGPTVVLLHGFPETSFAWRFQIPVLAEKFRVIAPDLRGYGETDKPAGDTTSETWRWILSLYSTSLALARSPLWGTTAALAWRHASPKTTQID